MNKDGEVVIDEADAFSQAVTIRHTHPENFLVTDKTVSNTHEMGDRNNGAQRCMAPHGESPRYKAISRDSHFTVVSFTKMTGELVLVDINFSGAKVKPEWEMGMDILAEWEAMMMITYTMLDLGSIFPWGRFV